MLELRTFGAFVLRRPQKQDPQALQAQSKRLALFAYLALAAPRGFTLPVRVRLGGVQGEIEGRTREGRAEGAGVG